MYESVNARRSLYTSCRLSYAYGSARTHYKLKTKNKKKTITKSVSTHGIGNQIYSWSR